MISGVTMRINIDEYLMNALKEKLKNKTIEMDERLLNQVKCEN